MDCVTDLFSGIDGVRNMGKIVTYLISFMLFMALVSCETFPASTASSQKTAPSQEAPEPQVTSESKVTPDSAAPSALRTIFIYDEAMTEEETGGFISWSCQDYIDGGPTLVEVGFFGDPSLEGVGFILFDGGDSGELTVYGRTGLDRRWDWGPDGIYSFIIEPDGTGLYYDFSTVKAGKSKGADDIYQCYQR